MDWEIQFRPSWLCLKQHGPKKAIVVRIHPAAELGSGKARMYEGWRNGQKVSDPADTYKVGQVVPLD
jgi:hypothetical protein